VIKKPAWLLFGEGCREKLSKRKGTKSGKREEDAIYRWWLEACQNYGYSGTIHDWQCLMRMRGRR
jgi:hypothetical protein